MPYPRLAEPQFRGPAGVAFWTRPQTCAHWQALPVPPTRPARPRQPRVRSLSLCLCLFGALHSGTRDWLLSLSVQSAGLWPLYYQKYPSGWTHLLLSPSSSWGSCGWCPLSASRICLHAGPYMVLWSHCSGHTPTSKRPAPQSLLAETFEATQAPSHGACPISSPSSISACGFRPPSPSATPISACLVTGPAGGCTLVFPVSSFALFPRQPMMLSTSLQPFRPFACLWGNLHSELWPFICLFLYHP